MKTNDKPTSIQGEAEDDRAGRSVKKASRKSAFWSGALALGAVGVSAQSLEAQDAGDLVSVESAQVLPDGSLSVVLSDGRSLSLSPDEYEIVDGTVVIDPPVAEALGLAGSGGGLSLPLLGGVAAGVAALVGGAAALAGGGDSGENGGGGSANEPPVFTSGATVSVAENTETAVYTPVVTDADGDPLTFSLSGTDAALFSIDEQTGAVTFRDAADYEAPRDAGEGDSVGDNVYNIVITASDGINSTDQAVTITVTDVAGDDEAPVFTSGATVSVAENAATAVYTAEVTDADGDGSLTFTLSGGADQALFEIDSETGEVTFIDAPDFEDPRDAGGDNVYDIVITASDGINNTDQAVQITVTNENDEAPVFTSGAAATVAENTATAVYTAEVTDAEGDTLQFALSGTDAALFSINDQGDVTFNEVPDFENPGDLGGGGSVAGDNAYDIVITASDGTNSTNQAVTITVTDVHEPASVLDLSYISTAEGMIIVGGDRGDEEDDEVGWSVSSAGDVNGDGFDDVIVGAPSIGEAYVIYGGTGLNGAGLANIDLSDLTSDQGFIIQDNSVIKSAGYSVSSAGDVNGDGFDDVIVGAHHGDDGGTDAGTGAGEAYVIYGGTGLNGTGLATIDLSELTSDHGFIIKGDAEGDRAGRSVSSAGDVNGDGFDDVIVGASNGDDGGLNAGEAYVIYGGTGLNGTGLANIDLMTGLTSDQGFIIQGDEGGDAQNWADDGDWAGFSVSSAGDVNGDGFDDVIVGAHRGDDGGTDAGEAYVIYGGTGLNGTGLATIDLTNLTIDQGFIIQGDNAYDWAGRSVSSAGDVNGDGFDDLIVGASNGDDGGLNAGEAYVIYGGTGLNGAGLANIDLSHLTVDQGFIIQGDDDWDWAGFSVSSAGDVNGDGFDDVIVGAPGNDGGGGVGEAYVIYGGTELATIDLTNLTVDQGFIIQGDSADDSAGRSVSSAGDVNGDGFDDLIVGAHSGDDGGTNAGEAYVLYGGATGTESTLTVTRAGTDGVADNFTGNAGNDTFTGIGAGDVVRGGAGDDSITLTDLNFAEVDGGHGDDTLLLDGSGLTLDLTGARTDVESFEIIDLTGTGNNTLVIDALSLFDLSGDTVDGITTFKVTGDTGDQVSLTDTGWSPDPQQVEDGVTFNVYGNGQAEIWIEEAVTVSM